jgi:predicted AAA+ superfamily ATPase
VKTRTYWVDQVERAWERRSVVWLHGVRRVGKTVLCQCLENVEYLDCELPRVRRTLEDPEAFLAAAQGKRIVLDEVQRLPNPSELLKIAADHYPTAKLIATGSSTLQASTRFRDTLTGRKAEVWLTPLMSVDLADFGAPDLQRRLRQGGLPGYYLNRGAPARDYEEWIDAFWARDVQELFRLERRWGFQRLLALLLTQSGGLFEATRFAGPCEISRTTVATYLDVLEATRVVHVVRPFATQKATEITAAPKVYGFDTGFVFHYRGWTELRLEDVGDLWEHFVLNEIHARTQSRAVNYWRDKRGHEVDFVLPRRGGAPIAIECKWSTGAFEPKGLGAFRRAYPTGPNWVVTADIDTAYTQESGGLSVDFISLRDFAERLANLPMLGP